MAKTRPGAKIEKVDTAWLDLEELYRTPAMWEQLAKVANVPDDSIKKRVQLLEACEQATVKRMEMMQPPEPKQEELS